MLKQTCFHSVLVLSSSVTLPQFLDSIFMFSYLLVYISYNVSLLSSYRKELIVFVTNSDFLILITLQPNNLSLKLGKVYTVRYSTVSRDLGIRQIKFVAKN